MSKDGIIKTEKGIRSVALPISKDLSSKRTREYAARVYSMYKGFFTVKSSAVYAGPKNTLSHRCHICGANEIIKPKTVLSGRGCSVCKTTADDLDELSTHISRLKNAHNGRYVLIGLPPRFTGASKEMHRCTTCGNQHIVKPEVILNENFECGYCTDNEKATQRTQAYQARLDLLYKGKIKCLSKLHLLEALPHSCSCNAKNPHIWHTSIANMLTGNGCPKCLNKVSVPKLSKTVEIRGKKFLLRKRIEGYALRAVALDLGTVEKLETAYTFPIPLLGKKHIPAFYATKRNKLIDVITYDRFLKIRDRVKKRYEAAEALGYNYGVVVIRNNAAVVLNTVDWLREKRDLPKDLLKADYVIGSQNVRSKILEISKDVEEN